MVKIYYGDGSLQVINPPQKFDGNTAMLVKAIAQDKKVKRYIAD